MLMKMKMSIRILDILLVQKGDKNMRKTVKKVVMMGLVAGLMCVSLAGCEKKGKKVEPIVDMKAFEERMLDADTTLPEMKKVSGLDENAELNFTALSDFEYEKVEDYFYCYAQDGDVQEIAVIALKDEKDAAAALKSLHNHVDNRVGTLQEYSPEKVDMAKNAVITSEGRYVTMIICEKTGLVQNAFKDFLTEE